MRTGKAAALAAVIGLMVASLGGCGSNTGTQTDGVLTVAVSADLSTGDPIKTGAPSDQNILVNVYDPLTRRTENGDLEPGLATKWEATTPTVWKFSLREGVTFQNGESFDSSAVKASLERVINDPKSVIQELKGIKEIQTPDPLTVLITTATPDPSMPARLALFGGLMVPPRYAAEDEGLALANKPVGTGPYSVEVWDRGSQITLVANDDYWAGAPAVKRVTVRFIPDDSTRIAALLNGEVQLINGVPPTSVGAVEGNASLRVDTTPGTRIYYASLANREGPLADRRVRQALSYATDYGALIDKLMAGDATRISGPLAQSSYGASMAPKPYEHDPGKAKSLLADAGYPNGFTIDFASQQGIDEQIAVALSNMWSDVGVEAKIDVPPQDTFDEQYETGTLPPIFNGGYTVWQGDPTVLINSFFRTGMPRDRFGTPEFDKVINCLNSEMNDEVRAGCMATALHVLHDEAPWIYIFQANDLYGVAKTIEWKVPFNQQLRYDQIR